MNWSRVKTVLIILFLCTDIFLLATYFTSRYSSSSVSQEVIDSTVTVLANNDITINPDVIPKKAPKVHYIDAENVISDYQTFAKSILGDELYEIDYGFESPRGKITFYGDRFNFIANTQIYALADIRAIPDEKTAKEAGISSLVGLGFVLENAEVAVSKTDSGFLVTISDASGALPVFISSVEVVISDNVIASVSGVWFNVTSTSGEVANLKSVTSALIDFIPDAPPGINIVDLSLGYSILDPVAYHKTSVLIPVWRATDSLGNVYYIDARNL